LLGDVGKGSLEHCKEQPSLWSASFFYSLPGVLDVIGISRQWWPEGVKIDGTLNWATRT